MYQAITANKRKTVLLIILFVMLIGLIGWAFQVWFQTGPGIVVLAVAVALGTSMVGYYSGDRIALSTAGALPIQKEQNPYVYRLVENLCITAGLAMPRIYIINDSAMNAFATGRDPKHASIALTTGIIEKLENEELEGVIAHELSHIKNFDIRLMTIVIVCVGIIVLMSDFFLRGSLFGGRRNQNDNNGNPLALVGLALIILSPLFAKLIQLAVSRKREFLADASGVLLTRYPAGLANALEKIAQDSTPLRRTSQATAHLYIANPLKKSASFANLFSTHPPITERINILRTMA
ncbi:MAG: M48 family metallopeptidase [Patescibacteria group bacterium]|jgi:heat shock protein HtpX